jgi:pyrroloquinoline quinone (PQQ) biosynthesis protein C
VAGCSPEDFREELLTLAGRILWEKPHALTDFYLHHMSREGALVYALEHSVLANKFPRWFGNMVGNCPHIDVRRYMIENMYVEEVNDPTIRRGHYESLVDFAVALGSEREYV